jgi:hypothetical protein
MNMGQGKIREVVPPHWQAPNGAEAGPSAETKEERFQIFPTECLNGLVFTGEFVPSFLLVSSRFLFPLSQVFLLFF